MRRRLSALERQVIDLLRSTRLAVKVTQEQLAERLDVTTQVVSRLEAGQNITIATLERFAKALGQVVTVSFAPNPDGPEKPRKSRRQRMRRKA